MFVRSFAFCTAFSFVRDFTVTVSVLCYMRKFRLNLVSGNFSLNLLKFLDLYWSVNLQRLWKMNEISVLGDLLKQKNYIERNNWLIKYNKSYKEFVWGCLEKIRREQ